MRIISGQFKGRILTVPHGKHVRPTLSSLREAVFNTIQQEIEGALFLDLFAGSGAIGLEALSRGADKVIFIDSHPLSCQAIRKNCQMLGVEKQTEVIQADVFKTLNRLKTQGMTFQIIYADPPYEQGYFEKILNHLNTCNLIDSNGHLFIEESKKITDTTKLHGHFKLNALKKFGDSHLFIFTHA